MKSIATKAVVSLLVFCFFALFGASNVAFADSVVVPTGMHQFRPIVKLDYRMAVSNKSRLANKAINVAKLSKNELSQNFYIFKYTETSGVSGEPET